MDVRRPSARRARLAYAAVFAGALVLAACGADKAPAQSEVERSAAKTAPAASAARPVVVELYQSQGCSSCPPANANLNAIAERDDLLALSFAVTYWDRLGWKDVFAKPEFTDRQWDYAHAAGRKNVATPQVIINGGAPIVGSKMEPLQHTIAERGAPQGGPDMRFESGAAGGSGALMVDAGPPPSSPATVWLVRYDPRAQEVAISAGENTGRTLPHKNIVRELKALGEWNGAEARFALPQPSETGLRTAAFLQVGKGGPIISSAKMPAR